MEDPRSEMKLAIDTAVSTDQHNLKTTFEKMDKELQKLPLPVHGSILQMLQTSMQLRQNSMQMALEEFKLSQQLKAQEAEKKRQVEIANQAAQQPVLVR